MALTIAPTALAADAKIAHVDLIQILQTYQESDPAYIRLREEIVRKKQEFDIKREAIVIQRQALEQMESKLTADEMAEKSRLVTVESTALITLINEAQRNMQAKEEFLRNQVGEAVRAAISGVAKEEGYQYVIDGAQRPIIYADDSLNITDSILKKIMKDR
jgi:outer membrane protein